MRWVGKEPHLTGSVAGERVGNAVEDHRADATTKALFID